MIRINKGILILLTIIIVISCLLIGLLIGCSITPGSIVRTKTKEVIKSCEHISLEDANVIEQSIIYSDDDEKYPTQRILYNQVTDTTYVYTYFWQYRPDYTYQKYLQSTEIFKINSDGDVEIIKE